MEKYDLTKLPEKWCFKGCEEAGEWQSNELENDANYYLKIANYYYTLDSHNDILDWNWNFDPIGVVLTFQEFLDIITIKEDVVFWGEKRMAWNVDEYKYSKICLHSDEKGVHAVRAGFEKDFEDGRYYSVDIWKFSEPIVKEKILTIDGKEVTKEEMAAHLKL